MASYGVILLAAGGSTRFKNRDKKPFADLDGRAVWLRSLELFSIREDVRQILIVIAEEDRELFDRRYRANVAFLDNAKLVHGGKQRQDSVANALAHCRSDVDFIAVHDAARPCLTAELLEAVFSAAAKSGGAALACPVNDTVKRANPDGTIAETVSRENLWLVQTPQVFRRQWLLDAYAQADAAQPATDDAQLVERLGHPIRLVASDATNLKLTTARDLSLAAAILKSRPKPKGEGSFHPFADEQMWK